MKLLTLVKVQFAEYTTSVSTMTGGMDVTVPIPGQVLIAPARDTVRLYIQ